MDWLRLCEESLLGISLGNRMVTVGEGVGVRFFQFSVIRERSLSLLTNTGQSGRAAQVLRLR